MRTVNRLLFAVLALACTLTFPQYCWSQAVWGTINGYVTDPSGAAVPNAAITVTNTKTGVATKAACDAAGFYNMTHLNPGEYSLSVEAAGFKKFIQQGIVLEVDSTVRVEAHLELGPTVQEVNVTGAPPMLKTEKTDVAQSFNERTIEALPVIGNNVTQLYNVVPGAVNSVMQAGVGENPAQFNSVMVNGAFFGSNEYIIDGLTDLNAGHSGFQIIVPNQAAVSEMKVTTADYDPEFGSAAGMVAQFVTKSGSNDLHGSAAWSNRNKATFAADPFSEKIPGTGPEGKGFGPAPFNWNQGAVSLGGPIKKNRMFFFGDYQFDRTRQGGSILSTVPNAAYRAGDFSSILGANICSDSSGAIGDCGGGYSVPFMVATTEAARVQAQENMVFDPTTGNEDGTGRSVFSSGGRVNVIPSGRINAVATNLLALMPPPNLGQMTDNNFAGGGTVLFDTDQFDVRYDTNISDKSKFFARYTFFRAKLDNPALFGREAGGPAIGGLSPETGDYRSQQLALNYTYTLSPSLLTEARVGLVRFRLDGMQDDAGLNTDSKVGIPNINTGDALTQGLAGIGVSGPVGGWFMGIQSGVGLPRLDRTTVLEGVNNWTKMKSSHQIRWGVDFRRIRSDVLMPAYASSRGNFNFGQTITANADVPGSGLGMATFLLGMPSEFDRTLMNIWPGDRESRWAFYVQDVWRATPKLTLNYGLRYEYLSPFTPTRAGQMVNVDLNTGEIVLAGLGNVSRSANVEPRYDDFAPRLGFAYQLTQKSVLRAGFGRSYFISNYGGGSVGLNLSYPVVQSQFISQSSLYEPIFPIQDGPPAAPAQQFPSSGRMPIPSGQTIYARDFHKKTEHVDFWNFSVDRQLARNLRLAVAYVGNKAESWDDTNINVAPAGPGDFLTRRPYYQEFGIGGGLVYDSTCIPSNYNALQVVVEKRFATGYSLNSSYTWAKAMDSEVGGFASGDQSINPYDRRGSWGVSVYNRASVWTLTHVWQLPYGKGQHFGSNASGVKNAVLGGWQFNGITTLESGWALSPSLGDGSTLNGEFGQRPNRVPGESLIPAGGKTESQWYNVNAFAAPPACCVWGNAARGSVRGPGLMTGDLALWKKFDFKSPLNREDTSLEVRWENFNALNQTNLGTPNMGTDSSTAGQITYAQTSMRRMQFGLRLLW